MRSLFFKTIPLFFLGFLLVPIMAHALATFTTTSTVLSPADFKVIWRLDGDPAATTRIYAWIADKGTGTWIKRNIFLADVRPTDASPADFAVTFNFQERGIQTGKTYVYYLADGTTDSAHFLTNPACFTRTGGAVDCTTGAGGQTSTTTTTTTTTPGGTPPGGTTCTTPENCDQELFLHISSVVMSNNGTTATIQGELKASGETVSNARIKIYYDRVGTTTLSQSEDVYIGPAPTGISEEGVSFEVVLNDLNPNGEYNYLIKELSTNTSFNQRTFSADVTGNQVPVATVGGDPGTTGTGTGSGRVSFSSGGNTAVDGVCGGANGLTTSVITENSANLCAKGSVGAFAGTGPWVWTCSGSGGGNAVSCSASQSADDLKGDNFLKNPLAPGLNSFPKIFAAVINNIVLPIAIPFIAVMIIYSGLLFVIGRRNGNADGIKTAKETFMYTIIGAILVLGAFVIAQALQGTLAQLLR